MCGGTRGAEWLAPAYKTRKVGEPVAPYAPVGLVKCGRVNEVFTIPLKVERSGPNGTAKAAVGSASGKMRLYSHPTFKDRGLFERFLFVGA